MPNAFSSSRHLLVPLLLLLTMTFAGCRTAPRAPVATQAWEVRRDTLQAREQFELRGRVAVAAAGEGFNARLRWEQTGAQSQLALEGPLGVGGVQVTADGETFNVATSGGEQLSSEDARAALAMRLGFDPPISSLRYWVLGVPDPSSPAEEVVDAEQRLVNLRQNGWEVEYERYVTVAGQPLPARLTLRRGDVRVRLVVDHWGP